MERESRGVSIFQLRCSADDLNLDQTMGIQGLLNNAKCLEPMQRLELTLTRVLKYRTDLQNGERIHRHCLITKRLNGVPAKWKDANFSRKLDLCLSEIFPITSELEENNFFMLSLDHLAPFLQLVPTCVSQNFICYYQIEA